MYNKSVGAHVYHPQRRARGLERLIRFNYYTVLKFESRFIFGLNAVEIANYIIKLFKLKLLRIKFCTKKSVGTCLFRPRMKVGTSKIDML